MKKKIFVMSLATIMSLSLLTGCTGKEQNGTAILIDGANISASDGNSAEIAVGDYIQGYAEDPNEAELNATAILITVM